MQYKYLIKCPQTSVYVPFYVSNLFCVDFSMSPTFVSPLHHAFCSFSYLAGHSSNTEYWEKEFKNLIQNLPSSLLEEYGEEYMLETKELFQSYAKTANEDLSPVINTIVDALLSPQPQVRYYAGPGLMLMYFICSYFPLSISDWFLQKLFVKKKVMPRGLRKQQGLSLNDNNNSIKENMNNSNNNNSFTNIID